MCGRGRGGGGGHIGGSILVDVTVHERNASSIVVNTTTLPVSMHILGKDFSIHFGNGQIWVALT